MWNDESLVIFQRIKVGLSVDVARNVHMGEHNHSMEKLESFLVRICVLIMIYRIALKIV